MAPILDGTGFYILTAAEALIAIPVARLLLRDGRSPWWAFLCFVPILALIGLWCLAFLPRRGRPDQARALGKRE